MKLSTRTIAAVITTSTMLVLPAVTALASVKIHGNPTNYSYKQLNKNAYSLKGQRIVHTACVFQFDGATGPKQFLGEWTNMGYNVWTDLVQVKLPNARIGANAYEGDLVKITGYILGNYSYDTQGGGNKTVPSIMVTTLSVVGHGCD